MRVGRLTACTVLVVILAGCDIVASTEPVGGEPLRVEESEWKGTWLQSDGPLTVRVVDPEQGRLEVGWIEERDGSLVLETVDAQLRKTEDWIIASFTGVDDDLVEGDDRYLWGRLVRDGDEVFLWWPRPAEFRRLVETGLLPGEIEDGDVVLAGLEAGHLAIIVSEDHGMLFEWDEPMAFHRLQGE
jgi:hypothetical protein